MSSPLINFDLIFNKSICRWLKLCGIDLFAANPKLTAFSYAYCGTMAFGMASLVYTITVAEYTIKLQTLVLACIAFQVKTSTYICLWINTFLTRPPPLQGLIRFQCVSTHMKEHIFLIDYLRKIYEKNRRPNSESFKTLMNSTSLLVIICRVFSFIVVTTLILFTATPILYFLFIGQLDPILPVFLPFVDHSNVWGFFLLFAYHFLLLLVTALGIISADLLMGIMYLHVVIMVRLFELRISQLNDVLARYPRSRSSVEVHKCLGNIIRLHQDINR